MDKIYSCVQKILAEKLEKLAQKGLTNKTIRAAVVGIPNVGKSTFINKLTGKKVTITGDKPGVTKHLNWFNVNSNFQILDTPGILWPKFESEEVGIKLSLCQGIKDEIIDTYKVCDWALMYMKNNYRSMLINRYSLTDLDIYEDGYQMMEDIAKKRGFIQKGAKIDFERTVTYVLNDIRSTKIGMMTFEKCEM